MLGSSSQHNPAQQQQQFWQENQRLERYLEDELRKLKIVDTAIDNIVNEEFDKCNEIDEIEETIRGILSKKDHDHIRRAEPYYQAKHSCIDFLNSKKQEKERAKSDKLGFVKKILGLLAELKRHRTLGLSDNMKNGQKDQKQRESDIKLIERAIKDIKEIQSNTR